MPHYDILPSLEPQIAQLLTQHKEASRKIDWSYHDYLPLDAFQPSSSRDGPLSTIAYSAVETALLTEANLPWYTVAIFECFKTSPPPLQEFARIWTAEEDQHTTLLETYLLLTNSGDHERRRLLRKSILSSGWPHDLIGPFEGIVYTTIQETQTRAFYIEAARTCEADHADLARALRRIAKDESLHATFYRETVKAHLDADSSYILPLARVMMRFQMPGYVIPDYDQRHALLTRHVFGPLHYSRGVIEPLCNYWDVDRRSPASPEVSQAQRELRVFRAALRRMVRRTTAEPLQNARSNGRSRSAS